MSDPKSSYGEPVEEPKDVDDVVGRAHEGLADAEAARQGVEPAAVPHDSAQPEHPHEHTPAEAAPAEHAPAAVTHAESVRSEQSVPGEDAPATRSGTTPADASETAAVPAAASTSTPWYEREDDDEARWAAYAASAEPEPETRERTVDETPTVVAAPAVTASEPAATSAATTGSAASAGAVTGSLGQPIFVQAPEAPNPRGNRGAAAAIGLLAAVAFAVLYLAAGLGLGLVNGEFTVDETVDTVVARLTSAALWVPVIVFYIAFVLLGAIINRGRWGHWVVWGLLVGVAAWGGHILGALFQAPFWTLTAREGATLIETEVLAPLAIVAFVLGRELTIWFGAWVAARGRRVTEINLEAQREYERTLEAGPQLHRA
jgi:hypothetical protein